MGAAAFRGETDRSTPFYHGPLADTEPLLSNTRKVLTAVLIVAYVVQTLLVWRDPPSSPPLGDRALVGAHVWHQHNCQACHQLYGYGGFLGPDLTNAATVHGATGLRERLEQVMSHGSAGMPPIEASAADLDALTAWLVHLDATGIGQARAPSALSPQELFERANRELLSVGPLARGFETYRARACSACHLPLQETNDGAPDLSLAARRLDPDGLRAVLEHGRPPHMPPPAPPLTAREREEVVDWLTWLSAERDTLVGATQPPESLAFADLPWWEFE